MVTRDATLGRRLVDTLVMVWRRDGTELWLLIHVKIKGTRDPSFAKRKFVHRPFLRPCPLRHLSLTSI